MEEKINQIRELVREIKSYDDVLYMYEGDKIDLEVKKTGTMGFITKIIMVETKVLGGILCGHLAMNQ